MEEAIKISAVMPCLNEAASLAICIRKARTALDRLGVPAEIVVADNGSTDGSVAIAEGLGARVVHVAARGYGAALIGGITAARGEIVVMADADDSYDWSEIGAFSAKIGEGYDLVMGNRFRGGIRPGAMPPLHRYLGNPVLSAVARIVSRAPIGDFHCGMRAFTKSGFERMALSTSGMELATEMVLNAVRNGLRIAEIPIVLYPDKRGRPPHLRSFRDGWRHLRFILMYAPDYLFLAPAVLFLVPGLSLLMLLARGPVLLAGHFFGPHFLALGIMLTLLGFNTMSFGVQAKLIMATRHPLLRSRLVDWVRSTHALETSLLVGGLLALAGLAVDGYILLRWLTRPLGSMESTVHPAMVAATMVALGMNMIFSAFMLHIINVEEARIAGGHQ
ncbi:MAG TPA: glycosyltransferase family 2 protein [Rhodocyclaceae bacterium]|nr:glycosyltransferase family 2 protein [Rhodocyclaceae bacterium]